MEVNGMLINSTAIALCIAFVIVLILGPIMIPWLKKLKVGNTEREELESHQSKNGTPMMGGIMIIIAVLVASLIFVIACGYYKAIPVIAVMLAYGLIGFIDDFLKVVKKNKDGFKAWQKMLCQILVTVGMLLYLKLSGEGMEIIVPFAHGLTIDIGFAAIPVMLLAVIGTANGVNFSDGIDGLCSSITAVVAGFFTVAAIQMGSDIAVVGGAVVGALFGFLFHNLNPAKVFMGDTGSLALGGFVASMAYMLKMPAFILIVGLIYWIEILSVMLQVGYFKLTKGKRLFRMAPIHHHYELKGWSEPQVVGKFTIFTILMSLVAYAAFAW